MNAAKKHIASPVTWFGGKSRHAARIISHFPPHTTYVEPFGGSMAVLLAKTPSKIEVYNDVDRNLVNLFRVIRDPALCRKLRRALAWTPHSKGEYDLAKEETDDPVEAARRFMVLQSQSFGGRGTFGGSWAFSVADTKNHRGGGCIMRWRRACSTIRSVRDRIMSVMIDSNDFRLVLKRYDSPATLFYCDPPYAHETRGKTRYPNDMTDDDHRDLVEGLLNLRGMAALSGYATDLYKPLESAGWRRLEWDCRCYAHDSGEVRRTECLWLSPNAGKGQGGLFMRKET